MLFHLSNILILITLIIDCSIWRSSCSETGSSSGEKSELGKEIIKALTKKEKMEKATSKDIFNCSKRTLKTAEQLIRQQPEHTRGDWAATNMIHGSDNTWRGMIRKESDVKSKIHTTRGYLESLKYLKKVARGKGKEKEVKEDDNDWLAGTALASKKSEKSKKEKQVKEDDDDDDNDELLAGTSLAFEKKGKSKKTNQKKNKKT